MRPGDDDYEAQLEALRMLELERQAQVDAGTVGTNMPGAKVEFAPDSGMTPEPSRVPIQPKVVDLTTQPKGNLERSKAMRADWDNRSSQALERAGRELVAGLTRTQVAPTSEWDTGHFARFVADQERAAQREGRATQARLAGQKIDFDAKEAARKAATDEQQRKEDLAERVKDNDRADRGIDATNRLADSNFGIRREEAEAKKQERADKAGPGSTVPLFGGTLMLSKGLDDTQRGKAFDVAGLWNGADKAVENFQGALESFARDPNPTTKGAMEAALRTASSAFNSAIGGGAMSRDEAVAMSDAMGADILSPTGVAAIAQSLFGDDPSKAAATISTRVKAARQANRATALGRLQTYGVFTESSARSGAGTPPSRPTATGANGEKYQLSADGKSWEPIE